MTNSSLDYYVNCRFVIFSFNLWGFHHVRMWDHKNKYENPLIVEVECKIVEDKQYLIDIDI